jgi:protein subunit release factor B
MRELLFSVTLADCDVQTFRAGGKGGQKQNKTESGVRIIHRESGARGEARDSRHQRQNKKEAFRRMVESSTFQAWLKMKTSREDHLKAEVERELYPNKIKTEVFQDGQWMTVDNL